MKKSVFLLMALTSFMIFTVVPVIAEEGSSKVTSISAETTRPHGTEVSVDESTEMGAAIHLGLEKESHITVNLLKGKEVILLHKGLLSAGTHTFLWNGKDKKGAQVPIGSYAVVKVSQNGQPLYQQGFSVGSLPEEK